MNGGALRVPDRPAPPEPAAHRGASVELRHATPIELSAWDALVRRFANHRVTHLRAWIESLAAAGCGEPLYLVYLRDGEVVGCLPGLIARIGGVRLFGSPLPGWQSSSMGLAFDPERLECATLISLLARYLEERHGIRHIELMQPGLDPAAMQHAGFAGSHVATMRAPLTPADPPATLARLKESARRNIKRAERLGLEVRFGVDAGFVAEHYAQLREVYRRRGERVTFSERRLRAGVEHLADAGALIAASVFLPGTERRIATATFVREGRELLLWMWAHRTHYRWYRPTELMTWRVLERAMSEGCETVDFMGRGDFKMKFGASADDTKMRWIRPGSVWLAAARPVAAALYRAQQVVRGRIERAASDLRERLRTRGSVDGRAPACVLGDIDLVSALGLRGIDCWVAAPPHDAARYSRHTLGTLPWADPWDEPERAVTNLLRFAEQQPEPPTLFFEDDGALLLVSRHRERLARAFRFVIAGADLVESLVDKARFQQLARSLALPVPAARALDPAHEPFPDDLPFEGPFILKPLTRRPVRWAPIAGGRKALLIASVAELRERWPALVAAGEPLLAQELVPGPESAIESYHVYVDTSGAVAADFTGRKIRTHPRTFGDSSALEITDAPDLRALGRDLTARLGLRGVAKFDFKRRPDGSFALLEVNPRFTLWHHPAACAGLNIPALVHDDLLGRVRRDPPPMATPGVRWCKPWTDRAAAAEDGFPFAQWVVWAARCEAKRAVSLSDPLPLLRAGAHRWWHRVTARAAVVAALLAPAAGACADRVSAPPPPPIPAVRISGAADIATCYRQTDSATAAILDSLGGDVFTAGDNLHDSGDTATYAKCYGATWGRFLDRTHPAIGNHDYDQDSGARYFEYFGARAGEPGRGWYSFDLGAWHVIVLNSHAAVVGTGPGSEQERWLRNDLATNRRECTMAVWHHPRFYQGTFNRNLGARAFWAALHEARAEVVVNGHFHLYERYAPQDADAHATASGPRQFTVGTGGRGLDVQSQAAPNLEFRQNAEFGVLTLELGDGWYEWAFIGASRAVLDSGRATCR